MSYADPHCQLSDRPFHSTLNPTCSTHFVCCDGNGNVAALAEATTGTNSAIFEYGPFSEPIRVTGAAAQAMPLRFSTMYEDAVTGDRKYLFRDLNPSTGRWKSRDPMKGGQVADGSLYTFIHNAPTCLVDLFGLMGDNVQRCCVCNLKKLLDQGKDDEVRTLLAEAITFQKIPSRSSGLYSHTRVISDFLLLGKQGGPLGFALLSRTICGKSFGESPLVVKSINDEADKDFDVRSKGTTVFLNLAYSHYMYLNQPMLDLLGDFGEKSGAVQVAHELAAC